MAAEEIHQHPHFQRKEVDVAASCATKDTAARSLVSLVSSPSSTAAAECCALKGRKRGKWFDYYIAMGGSVESFMDKYSPGYERTKLKKEIEICPHYHVWLNSIDDDEKKAKKATKSKTATKAKTAKTAKKKRTKKKLTKVKTANAKYGYPQEYGKNDLKVVPKALSRITKPVAVEIRKEFQKFAYNLADKYGIDVSFPRPSGFKKKKLNYGPVNIFSAIISIKPELRNLDDPAEEDSTCQTEPTAPTGKLFWPVEDQGPV